MYEGPIKCSYVLRNSLSPDTEPEIKIEFEHLDGSPVSSNEEVDIGGPEWEHAIPHSNTPLKWKLENYTPDILDTYWTRRAFATMFRSIGLIIPQKFKAVTQNDENAFFNIRFTDDLSVFDDRPGVLAHAYLYHPQNDPKYNGLMEWNDNHFFTPFGDTLPAYLVDPDHFTEGEKKANGAIKTLATQPLLQIGMHELDHNFGLRHDTNSPESLMYPFVKRGVQTIVMGDIVQNIIIKEHFQRTEDDLQRYENKYGRRNLVTRKFNHMRSRRVRGREVPGIPYQVAV
jgi:hypothetical protein